MTNITPSLVQQLWSHVQSALNLRSGRKQIKAQACQEQGIAFLPIAMETLGGFHKVAAEQVKRIGVAVARHQGVLETVAVKQLFQRLSLTLMRGNASLVMTRRPDSDLALAEVDGII